MTPRAPAMGMATLADTDRLHLVRATTGPPDRQAARLVVRDPVRACTCPRSGAVGNMCDLDDGR